MRRLSPILALALAAGIALSIILLGDFPEIAAPFYSNEEIIEMPHGRVLNVVIEPEGIFLGDKCIPPVLFADYIQAHKAELIANYIIVTGTEDARYGDMVTAFVALRHTFKGVGATVETRPLPPGERRRLFSSARFWGCL